MPDFEPACPLSAFSLTNSVVDWFISSRKPRILHVFDRACNLINEHGGVLSIVTTQIGNGPFNLVVKDDIHFHEYFTFETSVMMQEDRIQIGNITIDVAEAERWDTRPPWENLHHQRKEISAHLSDLPFTDYRISLPRFPLSTFSASLAIADLPSSIAAAKQLAGLGQGLTPSGDDFLMGALYAAWIIHPHEIASQLALEISEVTAPLTTSLSAAWLRSAGKGEAGTLWHELFNALITGESYQSSITKLLSIGETSGADALAGFLGTLISYAEVDAKPCPS